MKEEKGLRPIGEVAPGIIRSEHLPISPVQERLMSPPDGTEDVLYQHTVLCQTCIPYRNPGDDVKIWKRKNGRVRIEMQAGRLLDPATDEFVDVGLPYGPKPRLVLYHLNAMAIKTKSPYVEMEDSLTAFVRRVLGETAGNGGRAINTVKDQLNRLAASDFRFGLSDGVRSVTVKGSVIKRVELWTPRDASQRILWPTTVQFSPEYFENLLEHSVPLNEGAIGALSHSAMALDIYTWLAQRLRRVDPSKPSFVPWISLKEQFGENFKRMNRFKESFRDVLKDVKSQYQDARYTMDNKGLILYNSPPPVPRRDLLR